MPLIAEMALGRLGLLDGPKDVREDGGRPGGIEWRHKFHTGGNGRLRNACRLQHVAHGLDSIREEMDKTAPQQRQTSHHTSLIASYAEMYLIQFT